LRDLNTVYIN